MKRVPSEADTTAVVPQDTSYCSQLHNKLVKIDSSSVNTTVVNVGDLREVSSPGRDIQKSPPEHGSPDHASWPPPVAPASAITAWSVSQTATLVHSVATIDVPAVERNYIQAAQRSKSSLKAKKTRPQFQVMGTMKRKRISDEV